MPALRLPQRPWLSWEEWVTLAWVVGSPYVLHWWTLLTVPLVLPLVLRGSSRRLSRTTGTPRSGGSGIHPRAVNLLPGHGAFTSTKEPGTRTPGTAITEECSSPWRLGKVWPGSRYRVWQRHASSSTERGSSIAATEVRGSNGEPLGLADSGSKAYGEAVLAKLNPPKDAGTPPQS